MGHPGGILSNLRQGIRWGHGVSDFHLNAHWVPRRYQLIRHCPQCYYWTDGFYHYNKCTRENVGHWHRKICDQTPAEGYRPSGGKNGPGPRQPMRRTFFTPPIWRLGTIYPVDGQWKKHGQNPLKDSFNKYMVMRRFHRVGRVLRPTYGEGYDSQY